MEHIVFAVHRYAFMIFYLLAVGTFLFTVVFALLRMLHAPQVVWNLFDGEMALMLALGGGMVWYIQAALRRYYGSGHVASLGRALVLFSVQGLLIAVFHNLLFHTVLLSL